MERFKIISIKTAYEYKRKILAFDRVKNDIVRDYDGNVMYFYTKEECEEYLEDYYCL